MEKKYQMIGTAGHVDHGKTCLVKALTGIDTDRLKEEKKRGITIELGFAYLTLPDGETVGIIDVPGHEKFIKNMLAGAGGIDAAMLVIAADEGVMPQTREHLEILTMLGIKKGILVMSKIDLAEKAMRTLVEEDIKLLVKGTFLEKAPFVEVSIYDARSIERLKEVIFHLLKGEETQSLNAVVRLPIDRIFSMKGFGTVVTGTLIEGKLDKKEEMMLYPSEKRVKIRKIEVHSKEVEAAYAGQRVAVNIPNLSKTEIKRGNVLASIDSMQPTRLLNVQLTLIKGAKFELKTGSRVHLYHGASEVLCKVILLIKDTLKAGESGEAQLRLEEELAAKKGDYVVIRFYSPVVTIGGGVILDANPLKYRKSQRNTLEEKIKKEMIPHSVSAPRSEKEKILLERIEGRYLEAGLQPLATQEIKMEFQGEKFFNPAFSILLAEKTLLRLANTRCIHRKFYEQAQKVAEQLWAERGIIILGEYRDALKASRTSALLLLEYMDKQGITKKWGEGRILK